MTDTAEINWNDETTRKFLTSRVARRGSGDTRRRCFYIDDVEPDENGIIPMLVIEGETGYRLMVNEKDPRGTWYWGRDLEEAQRICDLVNAELFGLTRDQTYAIVGASMEAQGPMDASVKLGDADQVQFIAGMPQLVGNGHRVEVSGLIVYIPDEALDVLAELPEDHDGHYDGTHLWIGGTEYPVEH